MFKRKNKSEKETMLDRAIAKQLKNITTYKYLEYRHMADYAVSKDWMIRDMAMTERYAAKGCYEMLVLLCELRIRRKL